MSEQTNATPSNETAGSTPFNETVDAAIKQVLAGGQSYRLGERQLQRANLADLMRLKREADIAATAEASDPLAFPRTSVAVFDRR